MRAREKAAAEKQDKSFATILARYIKARRRDGVRKVDEDEQDFNRECLPAWKDKAVGDITMADILKVVEAIRDRGKTRQALNMAQKIGTFFNWCADDDLIPASPYRPKRVRIALGERQSRDRVLTDNEIRAFWTATAELDATYRDVYRLLLLTGQRLNDIAQASWSEIDHNKKTLTVPAARFKSDRDHVVPLTDDVIAILDGRAAVEKLPVGILARRQARRHHRRQLKRGSTKDAGRPAQGDGRRQRDDPALGQPRPAAHRSHAPVRAGRDGRGRRGRHRTYADQAEPHLQSF